MSSRGFRIAQEAFGHQRQSCLMQDEPEEGGCFSHRMSLKGERSWMLGIDHPRASSKSETEPGADPGVSGIQRRDPIQGQASGGGVRLGDANAARAGLWPARQSRQGAATTVPEQDDRTEPGA